MDSFSKQLFSYFHCMHASALPACMCAHYMPNTHGGQTVGTPCMSLELSHECWELSPSAFHHRVCWVILLTQLSMNGFAVSCMHPPFPPFLVVGQCKASCMLTICCATGPSSPATCLPCWSPVPSGFLLLTSFPMWYLEGSWQKNKQLWAGVDECVG